MHVSVLEWLAIASTVIVASTVQGVVGFGSNLLAVPVVALIVPAALPGAMVVPGTPMSIATAISERDHIDWRGSRYLFLGRVPGTVLGVGIVAVVSAQTLAVVIGAIVILAVLVSVVATHLHPGINAASASVTGVASGFTGAAAAIDGPPLALLYQHDPSPVFRSTLATQFAIGPLFTITGLLIGGQLHGWQLLLGFSLIPGYFVGLALAFVIRPRVAHHNFRPAILAIAALAGAAAILRAVS